MFLSLKYKNITRNIYKWLSCKKIMMNKNGLDSDSVLVEVFGNNPTIRAIDFLITFADFDYPLTEIAKNSGVSYSTLQTFWHKLESNNIVIKTRRVGKSDLYKLNTFNPAVKELIKLDWKLTKNSNKEILLTA